MSNERAHSIFLCNGANPSDDVDEADCTVLDYRPSNGGKPNVRLGLPDFVRSVYHLPPRCLNLLEVAAYVFAGDRKIAQPPEAAELALNTKDGQGTFIS